MYSSLKNIQILVALLKKYNIKHIVISAGTRHTPLVYSVEHDDFFTTYSIVDERSASFFALGMIEELHEPVAICCTSGTAAANYVSAANEAFYQQLPLLILTADRNHYYMFQQEEQMIPQEHLYSDVCKRVVTLPHVRDDKDFWYCSRIANEALMELNHGEMGPVHINFIVENDYPIYQGIVKFDEEKLPDVRKMERLTLEDSEHRWREKSEKLASSKILIVYGQYRPLKENEIDIINNFSEKYNCMFSVDLLSNLHCNYSMPTFTLCRILNREEMRRLLPDIIITVNANSVTEIKSRMASYPNEFEHWHISSKGEISDPFKCLPDVIECSPLTFFKKMSEIRAERTAKHSYFDLWKEYYNRVGIDGCLNNINVEYSAMYAVQQYISKIPIGSMLHIANSNSIRLANYFDTNDNINVYGNRGSHGIDGSMSAFIGQANISNRLSFLLIGDLSFFYDMNALWNQYVGNNIRILVCNNSGGAIFYTYPNKNNVPSLADHIAAEHNTSVKAWVESRGFKYLAANSKIEFDRQLPELLVFDSECPIIMEVFTDKEIDAECIKNIVAPYRAQNWKQKVKNYVPEGMKKTIKGLLK
mgnify:FL=1